jgi:hypothetical protein
VEIGGGTGSLLFHQQSAPTPPSHYAVDCNGQRKFRKDFAVKGAKRRLRRLKTLDSKILSKHTTAVAIDGFL